MGADGNIKLTKAVTRPPISQLKVWYVAWEVLKDCMQEHLRALHNLASVNPGALQGSTPLSPTLIQQMDAYRRHIVSSPFPPADASDPAPLWALTACAIG